MRTLLTLAFTATMALSSMASTTPVFRQKLMAEPVKTEGAVSRIQHYPFAEQSLAEDAEPLNVQPRLLNIQQPRLYAPGVVTATSTDPDWVSLGMGTFTDGIVGYLYQMDYSWKVEVEQNIANPAIYRMVNPYSNGNCPWNANGTYTIRSGETNYITFDTTDPENVTVVYDIEDTLTLLNLELDEDGECVLLDNDGTGTFKDNEILFAARELVTAFMNTGDGFYAGETKLALPTGKDYSVSITSAESCFADNVATFTITAGADVDKVYVAPFSGGRYGASTGNFNIAIQQAIPMAPGTFTMDLNGNQWTTVFAMSVDENGNVIEGDVAHVYSYQHNPNEWTELGTGKFSDDTFAPLFTDGNGNSLDQDFGSWDVTILENVATPGLYRIVNPYESHPLVDGVAAIHHADHNHYLEVNASDSEAVTIAMQPAGLTVLNYRVAIMSDQPGTLAEGKITFPTRGIIAYLDAQGYYGNQNGRFSITLPEEKTEPEPVEPTPTEVDYTLDLGTTGQNGTGRYINTLNLSDDAESEAVTIGEARSASNLTIYQDLSDQTFATVPGATVTVKVNGAGSWMHTYAYVDWAKDGFIYSEPADLINVETYLPLEGSDLVFYNAWNPNTDESGTWYNSNGVATSNNQSVATEFTFAVPEDAAGEYRMRVKSAWQSLDPNGGIDVSASNNTIQTNGGTIVDFTLSVVAPEEPAEPNTYVTFEAYRKDDSGNHWGTWLQDANEPVNGTSVYSKSSTLTGTDDHTTNIVWRLTPGTEEGAYHVQNFVTGKYLVDLIAYGSTTVDEPVNIWLPEFTWEGETGVQICTGSTPTRSNCLDADNCDQLTGVWGNDAGNLWFMSTLDATTDEEVEALFEGGETPDPGKEEIVEALTKALVSANSLAELYLKSIPFMNDEIRAVIEVTLPDALENVEAYAEAFESAEEAQAFVDDMVAEIESQLVDDLNSKVDEHWTLYNPTQKAYLGAETKATNQGYDSFNYQTEMNTLGYWTLDPMGKYIMLQSAKGQYIATPKVHYCMVTDDYDEAAVFTLGVKDGYVVFKTGSFDGYGLGLDGQNDPVEVMSLTDGCMGWAWQVDIYDGPLFDGVSEISAAEGANATTIYDMQGRRVNSTSNAGLYIINGVKTLIRK